MNAYQFVSTALALLLYVPLCIQIARGEVRQNLATWILWLTLDGVVATSILVQGGNWYLPAAYVFGCTATLTCMVRARNFDWTLFETTVSLMVVACLVGWVISGPRIATILSTTGVVLAGLAQLKDTYKKPGGSPVSDICRLHIGQCFISTWR